MLLECCSKQPADLQYAVRKVLCVLVVTHDSTCIMRARSAAKGSAVRAQAQVLQKLKHLQGGLGWDFSWNALEMTLELALALAPHSWRLGSLPLH